MTVLKAVFMDLAMFVVYNVRDFLALFAKEDVQSIKSLPPQPSLAILPEVKSDSSAQTHTLGNVFYTKEKTFLSLYPTYTPDSVVLVLPYGAQVTVNNFQGRWAHVHCAGQEGWLERDLLLQKPQEVLPSFSLNEVYLVDATETIKLRSFIDDEFGGGLSHSPLLSIEYVWYRLQKRGVALRWPEQRPRLAGMWQQILKGVPGVHMGIMPSKGDVMEYGTDYGGQLVYVEMVNVEGDILVSGIREMDNVYFELEMSKNEWIELRPVFITIA